jgi:hypothetical protein
LTGCVLLALLASGATGGGVIQSTIAPPRIPGDSMRIELVAPATARAGEPVRLVLRVSNTGDRPITLYLQGRPTAFDLVVQGGGGRIVWRRLLGATVSTILGIRTLEPGKAIEFEDTWRQQTTSDEPVPPGTYMISGSILTDREPIRSPTVRLTITPS